MEYTASPAQAACTVAQIFALILRLHCTSAPLHAQGATRWTKALEPTSPLGRQQNVKLPWAHATSWAQVRYYWFLRYSGFIFINFGLIGSILIQSSDVFLPLNIVYMRSQVMTYEATQRNSILNSFHQDFTLDIIIFCIFQKYIDYYKYSLPWPCFWKRRTTVIIYSLLVKQSSI